MSVVEPTMTEVNEHYEKRIAGFEQELASLKQQRESLKWFAFCQKRKLDEQIESLQRCIESAGMIWSQHRRRAYRAALSHS